MPDTLTIQINPEDAERYRTCRAVLLEMEQQPEWEEEPSRCPDGFWRGRYRKIVGVTRLDSLGQSYLDQDVGVDVCEIQEPIQPGGVLVCEWESYDSEYWPSEPPTLVRKCITRRVSSIRPVQAGKLTFRELELLVPEQGPLAQPGVSELRMQVLAERWNRDHPGQPWRPDLWAWFLELET